MKVTVFYDKNNKRRRKTINYPDRDWLCVFDFEKIKSRIQRSCPWDSVIMRKVCVGSEEYVGLW